MSTQGSPNYADTQESPSASLDNAKTEPHKANPKKVRVGVRRDGVCWDNAKTEPQGWPALMPKPAPTSGEREKRPRKDVFTFNVLAKLLKVSTFEKWNEDWEENWCYGSLRFETEEEAEHHAQTECAEAWSRYEGAVLLVAYEMFDAHHLALMPLTEKTRDGEEYTIGYQVSPTIRGPAGWKRAARSIMETFNGIGPFYYSRLSEFLASGPWTPREAVLCHLSVIGRYFDVYGGGSAATKVERHSR